MFFNDIRILVQITVCAVVALLFFSVSFFLVFMSGYISHDEPIKFTFLFAGVFLSSLYVGGILINYVVAERIKTIKENPPQKLTNFSVKTISYNGIKYYYLKGIYSEGDTNRVVRTQGYALKAFIKRKVHSFNLFPRKKEELDDILKTILRLEEVDIYTFNLFGYFQYYIDFRSTVMNNKNN